MSSPKAHSEITQLQEAIREVQLRFSVFYGSSLTKRNVTLRQFSLLVALVRVGKLKMSDLAQALKVSLPAVTHLVDQLEDKRLIRRLPHPTDRRVTLIELTPAGAQTAAQTQGRALKLLTGILLKFPKDERATVQRFFHLLGQSLREATETSS